MADTHTGDQAGMARLTDHGELSNTWREPFAAAGVDFNVVKLQSGVHHKYFVFDGRLAAIES